MEEIQTGSFGGELFAHFKSRKIILYSLIGLVLVGVIGIVYFSTKSNNANPSLSIPYTPPNLTPAQQASYLANNNEYQSAENVLQNQLSTVKTANGRLAVYNQQVGIAVQFRKFGDAQNYLNKIYKVEPNSQTYFVDNAQIAQAEGKFSTAIQYWQKAIANLNPSLPYYNMLKSEYQAYITRLK